MIKKKERVEREGERCGDSSPPLDDMNLKWDLNLGPSSGGGNIFDDDNHVQKEEVPPNLPEKIIHPPLVSKPPPVVSKPLHDVLVILVNAYIIFGRSVINHPMWFWVV